MISVRFQRLVLLILIQFLLITNSYSEIVKKIEIIGNDRIPAETINVFSRISINDKMDDNKLNEILKNLYNTNYFSEVNLSFKNNILKINVVENPIVYNLIIDGVKSKSLTETLSKQLQLRERTPFNEILLAQDKINIKSILRKKGYFFSKVEIYKEELQDNRVDIIINVELGDSK